MRPDIMTVEMTPTEAAQATPKDALAVPVNAARKVWIVEGGYCSDTRYVER